MKKWTNINQNFGKVIVFFLSP